jgi:hypothetical protein
VKNYCLPSWVDSIGKIEGISQIVLANTSDDKLFYDYIKTIPFQTINTPGKNIYASIGSGRLGLLKKFLQTDATHFFSLECDMFVEPSIVKDLLVYNQLIVSVPYILGYIYSEERRLKSDYLISITNNDRIHYTMNEFLKETNDNPLVKVNEAGMGCSLIERSVIELYYNQAYISETRCDDQQFYAFCRNANIPRFVSVEHMSKVSHYPSFNMDYGVHEHYLKRKNSV